MLNKRKSHPVGVISQIFTASVSHPHKRNAHTKRQSAVVGVSINKVNKVSKDSYASNLRKKSLDSGLLLYNSFQYFGYMFKKIGDGSQGKDRSKAQWSSDGNESHLSVGRGSLHHSG